MIAILLATFNGSDFIVEQLQSITSQNESKWELIIRDDSSRDQTRKLIKDFASYDDRIMLLDATEQLGCLRNFERLMEIASNRDHQYVTFADQDDVWDIEKLSDQLKLMQSLEKKYPNSPILIHSDMQVVDKALSLVHPSFMQYQGIRHEADESLKVLLSQNFVTGCTVMVNRQLLDIALPIPEEALMHDWWLALCAAAFGKIAYIDKPLVKYRQHGCNQVGAKSIRDHLDPFRTNWYQHWYKGKEKLLQSIAQAQKLAQRIRKYDLDNPDLCLINVYVSLLELSPLKRINKLRQIGVHAQSRIRHILLLSRLLTLSGVRSE